MLNIVFLAIAAVLVWRFVPAGGLPMLRTMNKPATAAHETHSHAG